MSQQGSLLGASEKPCSGAMAFGLSCVGGLWSVLSAVSAVLCCVGFYMPYWLSGVVLDAAGAAHDTHLGLFRRCRFRAIVDDRVDVVLACGRYSTFDGIPSGWWKVSTVMVGAGAALALLVTAVALAACCLRHIVTPTSARVAGLLQFLAGTSHLLAMTDSCNRGNYHFLRMIILLIYFNCFKKILCQYL